MLGRHWGGGFVGLGCSQPWSHFGRWSLCCSRAKPRTNREVACVSGEEALRMQGCAPVFPGVPSANCDGDCTSFLGHRAWCSECTHPQYVPRCPSESQIHKSEMVHWLISGVLPGCSCNLGHQHPNAPSVLHWRLVTQSARDGPAAE